MGDSLKLFDFTNKIGEPYLTTLYADKKDLEKNKDDYSGWFERVRFLSVLQTFKRRSLSRYRVLMPYQKILQRFKRNCL